MIIEPFSLSELGIFVGSCCAALSGFIYSLSKSRCSKISSCCCECERDVLNEPVELPSTTPEVNQLN